MKTSICSIAMLLVGSTALAEGQVEKAHASIKRAEASLAGAADPAEVMYSIAARYAALNEKREAIAWLRKASEQHEGFDPSDDDYFKSLAGEPEFRQLVEELHRTQPAIHRSELAFTIPEKDLIPEGIAYDPSEKVFYLGSLYKRKIVKVTPDGEVKDFKKPREDGLWQVLGMKVDGHRTLWACSAAEAEEPVLRGSSAIFHFDLSSGKLIKKYVLDGKQQPHLFNDVALNAKGDVFVTDSKAGKIFWIPHQRDVLEELAPELKFNYPNGIALSADEKSLYVAHNNGGISFVDLASKKRRVLPRPVNSTLAGIDGLYLYNGTLVAIQNGIGTPRITRFFLNAAGDGVEKFETIEYRNPDFDVPTTGTFAGDMFYYIATSQIEKLDDDGNIRAGAELRPVLIMKTKL
jgi:hypothetical protein